ncbi:putative transmembrane protein [Toxoplasma gondii RUB]|uniref:Putative transmembrane protein n=1 Tax=Toxoplasma gondii RUB TaxID=935652 RepID=A0A086LZZ8_TOXGO|nr:putative transmembrane protein [Toxoplasma gondii RUB]
MLGGRCMQFFRSRYVSGICTPAGYPSALLLATVLLRSSDLRLYLARHFRDWTKSGRSKSPSESLDDRRRVVKTPVKQLRFSRLSWTAVTSADAATGSGLPRPSPSSSPILCGYTSLSVVQYPPSRPPATSGPLSTPSPSKLFALSAAVAAAHRESFSCTPPSVSRSLSDSSSSVTPIAFLRRLSSTLRSRSCSSSDLPQRSAAARSTRLAPPRKQESLWGSETWPSSHLVTRIGPRPGSSAGMFAAKNGVADRGHGDAQAREDPPASGDELREARATPGTGGGEGKCERSWGTVPGKRSSRHDARVSASKWGVWSGGVNSRVRSNPARVPSSPHTRPRLAHSLAKGVGEGLSEREEKALFSGGDFSRKASQLARGGLSMQMYGGVTLIPRIVVSPVPGNLSSFSVWCRKATLPRESPGLSPRSKSIEK